MAKNQATDAHRSSVTRDSHASGSYVKSNKISPSLSQKRTKVTTREILFPTEPTTIPREKIDRAIERVIARRK